MTAIAGLRGTGQFTADARPTNYRELYTLLEPNGSAPLNALLSMAGSESTDDPKFNHFRDELPARTLVVTGSQTSGDTALTVNATDDVAFVVPNVMLLNVRTNELLRSTGQGSGTSLPSVVRGAAGSSAQSMSANDVLMIVGTADQEGAGKPTAISFDPTSDYNFTQIFKTGISITGTAKATKLRTGNKEQEQVTKALKLHMADLERAFIFGRRYEENGSTAQPRRFTGGLWNMIPNVTDAASGFASANTITETEFDRLLVESIFAWGSKQKVMLAGPRVISNFQKIAKARWSPTQVEGAYGVGLTKYSTFAGDLLIYLHPLFRQVPAFTAAGIILDLPYVKYRYLEGRDTGIKRDVQAPDVDGSEHYYLTEAGLELLQGKPHTIIKNWQAA